jgi:ribosomal-protein-alanine N-acetyltransferase
VEAGVEGSDDMASSHYPAIVPARDTIVIIVPIRVFERSDLPGILRMERESFHRDAWPREVFLDYAAAVPELFLVARIEGKIAGYCIACLTRQDAELASLAVRPLYRNRRVATALLNATIRKLRRSGVAAIWLMVRRENEAAIRLYRKLGFVRIRTVPNYYDGRSTGWRMRISLRAL